MQPKNKKSENPKKRPSSIALLRYTDIAFKMGVTIALGAWLGKWLDGKMGMTKPVFLLIMSMLAIGGAIYMVIKDANKIRNE
ncbi:MAG: AtpZ/AtpI family protein [Saprospiraceae bacterium]|nr:AtpZ/AtpI family protein [Saprospiraceae bacterium]